MISVLIPIYNGIEYIDESVQSVLFQTYTDWELLIGINGHPENSVIFQKAKLYESLDHRIKVFDFPEIRSKALTLNQMVKHCKYGFVALLDVDDIWHHKKLEVQVSFLDKYDVVGSNCVWFGDVNNVVPPIPVHDISQFNFAQTNPIINSSSITRKDLCFWNNHGIEDYDMWLRLRKQNCTFYNCPEILVKHRIHKASAFNSKGHGHLVPALLKQHGLA